MFTEKSEHYNLFEIVSKVAPVGIFLHLSGKPIFVNQKLSQIFEYTIDELLSFDAEKFLSIVYPEDKEIVYKYVEKRLKGIKEPAEYRIRIITRSGKIKWVQINSETVNYHGEWAGIGTVQDITKYIKLEKAYKLLSSINREIVKIKDVATLFKRIAEIFVSIGQFKTVWIGEIIDKKLIKPVMSSGDLNFLGELEEILNPTRIHRDKINLKTINWKDHQNKIIFSVSIPVYINEKPIYVINLYSDNPHMVSEEEISVFNEISDDISFAVSYIRKEQDLYKREYFDGLTGLGNRKLLFTKMDELINAGEQFYLILLDIYNFKRINEIFGEFIADQILKNIAENLEKIVHHEFLFRCGSDEFAILWKDENVFKILEKIRSVFTLPISVKDHIISPDYNISVVKHPQDGKYRMELFLKAERTLQFAKNEGKNIIRFFNEDEYINTKKFFNLEEKIEDALKYNLFKILLQPIVSFDSNKVVGAEALIRLSDKDGNPIPPSEFIPVAEKTGQILMIDNLMIKKSRDVLKSWLNKKLAPVRISVNVTPSNIRMITESFSKKRIYNFFSLEFSDDDIKLLRQFITFELTEREFVEIAERKDDMAKLREVGFKIAIDDFGTGYSSLSYLTAIDLDFIKIDIFFVKNMLKDSKIHKLVQSIINIAKIFGIKTIAEGVENQEEYNELKRLGCDMFQGFLFSPPIPPDEFEKYLPSTALG